MTKKAVLILAYGSPENVDGMECYLSDIRGGRPMSQEFIDEFKYRYTLIGGKSPLTELTYEQARGVSAELQRRGYDWPVYVGMRHWSPWIKDTIAARRWLATGTVSLAEPGTGYIVGSVALFCAFLDIITALRLPPLLNDRYI